MTRSSGPEYGHIIGFRMSRDTGGEENRGEDNKDEKAEKWMKQECPSKVFDEDFGIFRLQHRKEWVIESGARPNGDA